MLIWKYEINYRYSLNMTGRRKKMNLLNVCGSVAIYL